MSVIHTIQFMHIQLEEVGLSLFIILTYTSTMVIQFLGIYQIIM